MSYVIVTEDIKGRFLVQFRLRYVDPVDEKALVEDMEEVFCHCSGRFLIDANTLHCTTIKGIGSILRICFEAREKGNQIAFCHFAPSIWIVVLIVLNMMGHTTYFKTIEEGLNWLSES